MKVNEVKDAVMMNSELHLRVKVHSFAVRNLELCGELSHSRHVMALYQLFTSVFVSHLQHRHNIQEDESCFFPPESLL